MNFSLVYGNNGQIENVVHGFANHNHDFLIAEALSFNLTPQTEPGVIREPADKIITTQNVINVTSIAICLGNVGSD